MHESQPMRYPVLYTGPQKTPEAWKTLMLPGRPEPLVFNPGPDFDKPYAYATELEARHISARLNSGNLFEFPAGLRNPDDKDDLWARIQALEARVAALEGGEPEAEPKRRGRKPKADEAVA